MVVLRSTIFQPTTTHPLTVARAVPTIILYSPDRPADRRRRRPTEFSLCWRDRVAVLILPFMYTLNTENKQIKYYRRTP